MNSVIRLCCCVNRVISGNPQFCCDSITDLLEENELLHADLSLFPRLALCPPSSGNLLYNSAVLSQCEQALDQPVSYTHLRAHETRSNLVCRLLLEKIFF